MYPPRPKGSMSHFDLPYYEQTGKWVAQRKFCGSRILIHVSKDKIVSSLSRHGAPFARFMIDKNYSDQLLESLSFESGKDYWLDGELLNKGFGPKNHIVIFDLLQAGRYMFGYPNQISRLKMLYELCNKPTETSENGMSLKISQHFSLAEVFENEFSTRFQESENVGLIEGLVLRQRETPLDNFGSKPYETTAQIRCRKPI